MAIQDTWPAMTRLGFSRQLSARDPGLGPKDYTFTTMSKCASDHLNTQARQSKHKLNLTFPFSSTDQIHCWILWSQIGIHFSFTNYNEEPDYVYPEKIWLSMDTDHRRSSMTHPDPDKAVSQDIFRICSVKIKGVSCFLFGWESPAVACKKVTLVYRLLP